MLRPAPPIDVLDLFGEERAELTALLRSLEPDRWDLATVCEGWTVHDIARHLLGDDLSLLARLRDGHEGARLAADDGIVAPLDAHNQRWVDAARILSPRLTIELLDLVAPMTHDYYASLPPDAEVEGVSWAGLDPAPHWLSVGREFTERWIHHQQIRDAVGRPGLNGPRFVAPVLALLLRSLPVAYRDTPAAPDTAVALTIEGRAGGNWALVRTGDEWELYEGRATDAAASVAVDQDTAWRFLTRNLSRAEAEPKMTLEGELARPFLDAVAAVVSSGR